jgi:hypothetical protein
MGRHSVDASKELNMNSVPVSEDGSRFDPVTCRRAGGYWVGQKGRERKYILFEDALAALAGMTTPRWRRPNSAGNWGLVAGTHWEAQRK